MTELSFVEVDEYVYPKQETYRLTIPVTNVWNTAKPNIMDAAAVKSWGDTFAVPESQSPVQLTPSSLTEQTDDKGVHTQVVTLLATNPGTASQVLPDFRIDGKAGDQIFVGQRSAANPLSLAAGEKKYIQYMLTTDKLVELQSLLLMTTETFVSAVPSGGTAAGAANPKFDIGRLKINISAPSAAPVDALPAYALGTPIAFDPLNRLLDSGTSVSLMELHLHENAGEGFKTVVAKLGSDGSSYSGSRQSNTAANLMPHLSCVVSYSFMVPASEKGDHLGVKLLDNVTTAPYSTTIAGFQTAVQANTDSSLMAFYPFNVQLNDWTLSAYTNPGLPITYSYKLNLTVDRVEDVVVDTNFSKFTIDLADGLSRTLGSQSVPFTGTGKLISGEQTVQINNIKTEQQEYPLTTKLYETIDTPNGEAKRLVQTLQQ